MKLPPCDKRRLDRATGIAMCYAIGCCEVGDMPCECEGCLASHGGKCPEGKDRTRKKAAKCRNMKACERKQAAFRDLLDCQTNGGGK